MRRKKHRTDRPLMPGKRPAIPRKGRAGKLRFSGTCWRFTTDLLGLYGGGAIAVGYPVCLHTEVSLSASSKERAKSQGISSDITTTSINFSTWKPCRNSSEL